MVPNARPEGPLLNGLIDLVNVIPGENLVMMEIGCFAGHSTEVFLNSGKFKKIFCVDGWVDGFDANDAWSSLNYSEIEKSFDEKINNINFPNVDIVKLKMFSDKVINEIKSISLDFLYIDGNHSYEWVKHDIQNYLSHVKSDGIISGHDFANAGHIAGVYKAVNEVLGVPHKTFSDTSWMFYVDKLNE